MKRSDHRVDPATRRSRVREVVLAVQGLWSEERFGYHGRFVSFEEARGRDPVPVTAMGARPDPARLEFLGSLRLDRLVPEPA
jgi:alkanesulfonate monooxygenase SsuD/methylene tetrahydromethanopterin reductase-like flavin-dependent oxidoreductase (luciferase family)